MTQYQKLLYEIFGKYVENFGYKQIKNSWYKISSKGIASFIGGRLLRGDVVEFSITFQPIISHVSSYFMHTLDKSEAPTIHGLEITWTYPLNGEYVYHEYPEIKRKKLMYDSAFREEISRIICAILEEHFLKYFTIDMSLDDCLEHLEEDRRQFFMKYGGDADSMDHYGDVHIETLLLAHKKYDVCLHDYLSDLNRLLAGTILRAIVNDTGEAEKEHFERIYDMLFESPDLSPVEYIELCKSTGMVLKPEFDERSYCLDFQEIKSENADIISALKADDYEKILKILETKHNEHMETYREMKIEVPPFSSYFDK